MPTTSAVDISQYQGTIDFNSVTEPIVIMKMSGGDAGLYVDSKANQNYYGAKAAGKALGMYHFAGGGDPANEADFFIAACSPLEKDDVMVLDWEIPHADPVGWCLVFVTRVHERTGVWPLIYMNLATLNSHVWNPVLANCGLWLAAWNNDPDATLTDKFYVMHQYSSNGTVSGIAGRVDLDSFFGSVAQFKEYGYQPPVTPPVEEPVAPLPTPSEPVLIPPIPDPPPLPELQPTPGTDNPTSTIKMAVLAAIAAIAAVVSAIIAWLHS